MHLLKPIIISLLIFLIHDAVFAQVCPPNIGFEFGNYQYWEFDTGICCPFIFANGGGPVANRHVLTNGPALDYFGNFPIVYPGGGNYSLKLNNGQIGGQGDRARYNIHIPNYGNTYAVVFNYAVVFQDPSHVASAQPRFEVSARDSATGALLSCSALSYVATSNLPGFVLSTSPGPTDVWYKNWDSATVILKNVKGKTITMEFAAGDCGEGGHFGYAYIDLNCGLFKTDYNIACTPGSTVLLTAPPAYQKYQWMDSSMTTILSTNQKYLAAKSDTTIIYSVVLTPFAGFGCQDTLFVTIANLSIAARKDTIVCLDPDDKADIPLSVKINGLAAPFTYYWYPAAGLSCTSCTNPIATVSTTTKYYISITDTNNCIKKDSVLITVAPKVRAKISLPKDSVCQYDRIEISENSVNPQHITHYWDLDTSGKLYTKSDSALILASWSTSGMKRIISHVSNGYCDFIDTAEIYVKHGPFAFFDIKYNICLGEVTKIYPNKEENTLYHWKLDEFAINTTSFQPFFDVSWHSLGQKHISLTTDGLNGCIMSYDTTVRIQENPSGKIEIKNNSLCIGDTIILYTAPGDYYTYEWSPPGIFLNANAAQVLAIANGESSISLKVASQWGCASTDNITIGFESCCRIVLPDAFTPNGDGRNDQFKILFSTEQYILHTFIVTNRWGNVLFETTNSNTGWDGTFMGTEQAGGLYFYYAKYICNNQTLDSKGTFILVR